MEEIYLGIGSRVNHPEFGNGVVIQVRPDTYEIAFIDLGIKQIKRSFQNFEIIEATEEERDLVSFEKVNRVFQNLLRNMTDIQEIAPIGKKWQGGKIILEPGDKNYVGKEIPMDVFFHKIVMIRDRLRVLEQRVNSSDLTDEEKVNIQQYITRIYGSLTSFNVLFADKKDHFIGEKSE